MNWLWVRPDLAIAWHTRLLAQFGGAAGLRDIGLLESALDRPKNLLAYHPNATVHELAALYGVAVAKAHAFTDGNKRLAFAVMVAFLKAHAQTLDSSEADATAMMLGVASSKINETQLAAWLIANCRAPD